MTEMKKPRPGVAAPERDAEMNFPEIQANYSTFQDGFQGRLAVKPKEAAKLLGIGVNAAYELCHRSDFPVVTVGSSMIIPLDGLRRWLDRQVEVAV